MQSRIAHFTFTVSQLRIRVTPQVRTHLCSLVLEPSVVNRYHVTTIRLSVLFLDKEEGKAWPRSSFMAILQGQMHSYHKNIIILMNSSYSIVGVSLPPSFDLAGRSCLWDLQTRHPSLARQPESIHICCSISFAVSNESRFSDAFSVKQQSRRWRSCSLAA